MAADLTVFCDGGARGNPGPGASACVIKDSAGKKRFLCGKYLGLTTNNQAEYLAVKLALETIQKNYPKGITVYFFLDSKLVVNQLSGLYKVKSNSLREIIFEIRKLEMHAGNLYYQHIRREDNQEADALVNQIIDSKKDINLQKTLNY